MTKEHVLSILTSNPKLKDTKVEGKRISNDILLTWFTYDKFDFKKLRKRLQSSYSHTTTIAKIKFVKNLLKEHDIDPQNIPVEPKSKEEKAKVKVKKIIQRYDSLFNLLNISTKEIQQAFSSNVGDSAFSNDKILKDLEEIYTVMAEKAKGALPTRSIETVHLIEEDENGLPVYILRPNLKGERVAVVHTQTHLPDERAVAMLPVIKELYDSVKGGNQEYLTPDEQAEEYAKLIEQTKKDKELYGDFEFTDAELVEED